MQNYTRKSASLSRAGIAIVVLFSAAFALAGPLRTTTAEDVGMSSVRLEKVTRYFEQLLEREQSGGYQLLVARRGKAVLHENVGFASIEDNTPLTDDSLFRIFSMTKPVMAVAMMMLYEEGHFSLADPLAKHIPQFADLQVYAGEDEDGNMLLEAPERPPTILDLMLHTAGFTYGIFGDSAVDKLYQENEIVQYGISMQDFIVKLAEVPLLFHPGERWHYSVSVDIQGYLVEKWSGQEAGAFLRTRIFEPLGMDETIPWVPEGKANLLASVYEHDEDGKRVLYQQPLSEDFLRAPGGFSGGAQLISTSDDYWALCQMLLNGGELNGVRLLSPGTVDLIMSDRLREPATYRPGMGYGLNGSVVTNAKQLDYPASNGEYSWGGLATTTFWVDPQEELVVIMLTQYLPTRNGYYQDILHRMVRAAIIE